VAGVFVPFELSRKSVLQSIQDISVGFLRYNDRAGAVLAASLELEHDDVPRLGGARRFRPGEG